MREQGRALLERVGKEKLGVRKELSTTDHAEWKEWPKESEARVTNAQGPSTRGGGGTEDCAFKVA